MKPVEESPTLPQARGLLTGTNIRVPIRQELKDINLSLSRTIMSVVTAQRRPTPQAQDPPRSTLQVGAPPRLTTRGQNYSQTEVKAPWGPRHLNHYGRAPLT
jgi:hypothetical protein